MFCFHLECMWVYFHAQKSFSSHRNISPYSVVLTDFGKFAVKPLRSWKQMFVSRPRGFLLLLIRLLHLFTFSIIYGSALWVTFVSGLILSNNLPQQQFSFMQSRIFPIYLRLLAAGELLLTMLHSLLHPWFSADKLETWQLQNFVWIWVATLINLLVFEPWETKVTNLLCSITTWI